jgi:hypothetical protein
MVAVVLLEVTRIGNHHSIPSGSEFDASVGGAGESQ